MRARTVSAGEGQRVSYVELIGDVQPAIPLAIMLVGMAAAAAIEQFTDPRPAGPSA